MMDTKSTPIPVKRGLRKLGANIRAARLRRRIPMAIVAERASISRATLDKIEKGDSGVSIGSYAKVLFSLGLAEPLSEIAALPNDALGLRLEAQALPKRIRATGKRNVRAPNEPE